MPIVVDDHSWPFVVVHWPNGAVTDDDVARLLVLGQSHLDRREPFVCVHVGMQLTTLDARQRRRSAEHVARHADALRRYLKAVAIVTPHPVTRAVVSAIAWLAPPVHPQQTFSELEPAATWVRTKLSRPRSSEAPGPAAA